MNTDLLKELDKLQDKVVEWKTVFDVLVEQALRGDFKKKRQTKTVEDEPN